MSGEMRAASLCKWYLNYLLLILKFLSLTSASSFLPTGQHSRRLNITNFEAAKRRSLWSWRPRSLVGAKVFMIPISSLLYVSYNSLMLSKLRAIRKDYGWIELASVSLLKGLLLNFCTSTVALRVTPFSNGAAPMRN